MEELEGLGKSSFLWLGLYLVLILYDYYRNRNYRTFLIYELQFETPPRRLKKLFLTHNFYNICGKRITEAVLYPKLIHFLFLCLPFCREPGEN